MQHNDIARVFRNILKEKGIPIDTGIWDHVIYKFAQNNPMNTKSYMLMAIEEVISDTLASIHSNNIMKSRPEKETLNWKSTIPFTCPQCGESDEYIVYLNIQELTCDHCNHISSVRLYCTNVELLPINPLTEEPL